VTLRASHQSTAITGLPVLRVVRHGDRHVVHDLTVDAQLQLDRRNPSAAPDPEAIARAILALAAHHAAGELEAFAATIGQHCLTHFADIEAALVEVRSGRWDRLDLGGRPRDRDLVGPAGELRVARFSSGGGSTRVAAGFRDMQLMTPATSELQPLLLLRLDALWTYGWTEIPFDTQWQQVRRALTEAYTERERLTGAHLATALARAVLDEAPAVREVEVRLEVARRHTIDMTTFGIDNRGEVFGDLEMARAVHVVVLQREEIAE
jgi:urate oxidase